MNASFVANAGGDLAQVNSQIKVKEENSMEEFNPWNREVNLLEKVLNNHDSIMKEGKDDREAASKPKFGARKARVNIGVSIEDNNSNLKQRKGGKSRKQNMNQSKNVLDTEIEGMWEVMMKQSKWRKMVAEKRKINQNLNLIDKKKKMEQMTAKV